MKLIISKYLIILLLLLSFSFSYAYDYTINDSPYSIENSGKIKVDLFVKKKVDSAITANKYINALNKINPLNLKDTNKKNIYYYLKYKLYTYINDNSPSIPATPKKTVQKPINIPITIPTITIPNISNIDTTSNLSSTKKTIIDSLKKVVKEYKEIDKNNEFVEYGSYYRIKYKQYYDIKWNIPVSLYLESGNLKNEILLRQGDSFILTIGGYSIEKKYSINDIANQVKTTSYGTGNFIFDIKNGFYTSYGLFKYKFYEIPKTGIYLSEYPGIDKLQDLLLLQQNNKYIIASGFTEDKLFNPSLLANNENPQLILSSIGMDNYFIKTNDSADIMTKIRDVTLDITKNSKNDNEKISAIYARITGNIDYDTYTTRYLKGEFNEETYMQNVNKAVFSGMETYRNKSGVCDGYSKLMQYMLGFAGINNVSIEIGNADIGKGKLVPHAWIKIGNLYYDPTWDYSTKGVSSKFKRYGLTGAEIHKTHIPSQ